MSSSEVGLMDRGAGFYLFDIQIQESPFSVTQLECGWPRIRSEAVRAHMLRPLYGSDVTWQSGSFPRAYTGERTQLLAQPNHRRAATGGSFQKLGACANRFHSAESAKAPIIEQQ